jgi:magnesium transporter
MITLIAFDFARKTEKAIAASEARRACGDGLYCWVDVEAEDLNEARPLLADLGFNREAISEVLRLDGTSPHYVYPDCLRFTIHEAVFRESVLTTTPLNILLNAQSMVTFHRQGVQVIADIKRTYRDDFLNFSKSPSFLLYEVADHLIGEYREALLRFSEAVEQVQIKLFAEANDDIFKSVAALTRDILMFRKVLLASRELLHQLASRRSPYVSETTQPFLDTMAGTLERLGNDLATERDVLTETLNLYIGMVSHHTSKVLKRLTMISIIFLPLTFLTGVYGMNLMIPETHWPPAYPIFWAVVIVIVSSLLVLMRRFSWL